MDERWYKAALRPSPKLTGTAMARPRTRHALATAKRPLAVAARSPRTISKLQPYAMSYATTDHLA